MTLVTTQTYSCVPPIRFKCNLYDLKLWSSALSGMQEAEK